MISSFLILAVHIVTRLFNHRVSTMGIFCLFAGFHACPLKCSILMPWYCRGPKPTCSWRMAMAETASNEVRICVLDYTCAMESQSKHIYGFDNWKNEGIRSKIAKKGNILANIAPYWQSHGMGCDFLSMFMVNTVVCQVRLFPDSGQLGRP